MATEKGSRRRKTSRQQRRFDHTRAKINDAARAVFSEKGLDAATVDDIVGRADVGRGTFYYHFSGKNEIISHLIRDVLKALLAEVHDRCRDVADLPDVLDALISAHIGFFSNRWEDFVIYFQGRADLTLEQSYEGLETPFMEYINAIEVLIDSVTTQPVPRPKLRRLACAIVGFISGYYSFAIVSSKDEDVDKTFMSLRSAFVASLVRFIREALPDNRGAFEENINVESGNKGGSN
jgi:AcrR family transcriptional regulator